MTEPKTAKIFPSLFVPVDEWHESMVEVEWKFPTVAFAEQGLTVYIKRDRLLPMSFRDSLDDNVIIDVPAEGGTNRIYGILTDEYGNGSYATIELAIYRRVFLEGFRHD